MARMLVVGLVFAALAAALHAYIFVMESVTWTSERTRATFGTTVEEAEATRQMAFNQGFYNLFLTIVTVIGIVAVAAGHEGVGVALVLAAVGSMLTAALVLLVSSPTKARAAVTQGSGPLIAVVALVISLLA